MSALDVINAAVLETAEEAALVVWQTGLADTTQMLICVRAGVVAAAPTMLAAERERIASTIETNCPTDKNDPCRHCRHAAAIVWGES